MSPINFKTAVRENVGLWINMIGGTGSGKTWSAMLLAQGIAGDKPFAVIDTENRRALHYADAFKFDHAELKPPFRPQAYADAVLAADAAGYPVIVIDSGSHVWAGDGGVLDWQEEELERMAGSDYAKRERVKMAAWIKPKMAHKQMVQKLLQVKAHIILCLRAEEKVEMRKVNGKTEIVPKTSLTGKDGWIPVCDKNLPFEATCSFLLLASNPGYPNPIKLQEQHKDLFPLDKPISMESGKRLALWASGGKPPQPLFDQAAPEIAKIKELCQHLNKANDSIKWTAGNLTGYIRELFDTTGGLENLDAEQLDILIGDLEGRLESLAVQQEQPVSDAVGA
jgi:hypothetical protein